MLSKAGKFIGVAAAAMMVAAPVLAEGTKVGFIGSLSSDTGLSTLRGAEMAIEELNKAGGYGTPIELVTADTQEDVTEGVKAYEYLAESSRSGLHHFRFHLMTCRWAGCRACKNIASRRWTPGPATSVSSTWLSRIRRAWRRTS